MFMYLRVFVLLYADDTVIIAESAEDLQKSLTAYALYCETWKLLVNGRKTKIVIFSRGRLQNFNFVLNDESIEIVKEFYLVEVGHFLLRKITLLLRLLVQCFVF